MSENVKNNTVDNNVDSEEEVATKDSSLKPEKITMQDVNKAWFRLHFAIEIPHSFDRYIAAALLWALRPILQKLYKDEEQLREAYRRHLTFFNTQVVWGGGTILGIVASMEEEKANAEFKNRDDTITGEAINNLKAGLMGALAGVGDSIDEGVVQYIFIAIGLPWAQQGNAIGAILPFLLFATYQFVFGWYLARTGYTVGRDAASSLIASEESQQLLDGLAILGLFMMGILAGEYVDITSTLQIDLGSDNTFVLQDSLDQILPGILPFATVMGLYFYFRKKDFNITKAIIGLTIILGVLAWIGIL